MVIDFQQYFDTLTAYAHVLEVLIVITAVLILISNLDDFFIDACYWMRRLYLWLRADREENQFNLRDMQEAKKQPIAIMVPAWKEYDVIYDMLTTNISLQRYENYHFFVGTYPNDSKTQDEVRRAISEFPERISLIITPEDGPTSKADCLNSVISEIQRYEKRHGLQFAGIVLHDSEDVIHPFELMLFNYLLHTKHDFIQLPVYSFPRRLRQLVAGCYMDEFAEWHTKDLLVRERLTGVVPCAGTSACFSRRSIQMLIDAAQGSDEVFKRGSLTEDYEISFRLNKLGCSQIFMRFPAEVIYNVSDEHGRALIFEQMLPIATRELFPDDFRAAYRQRARWLLGIVFQGWSQNGWRGSLQMKYFFVRDRKGVLTAPMAISAYFLAFNIVVLHLISFSFPTELRIPYDLLNTPWFAALLFVNMLFLINRLLQRIYFTSKIYGWRSGLMGVPRIFVSIFINFLAVLRAIWIYIGHLKTGEPIGWDKTTHASLAAASAGIDLIVPMEVTATDNHAAESREGKLRDLSTAAQKSAMAAAQNQASW